MHQFPAVVDNTLRRSFLACPQRTFFNHVQGLRPIVPNINLHAGGTFAKGIEAARLAFYKEGVSEEHAIQSGLSVLEKAYGDFLCPVDSPKTKNRMLGALEYYFQKFLLGDDGITPLETSTGNISVEVGFSFTLPFTHPNTKEPLQYAGRFDFLGQDATGTTVVVDEKTTGRITDTWASQWKMDAQISGYLYAASKAKESGLDRFVGIDPENFRMEMRGIAISKTAYGHARIPVSRQMWELERWYSQLLRDVERMLKAYEETTWDMALDSACNDYGRPCEYTRLCMSTNPERLIDGNYKVVHWNPLAATDTD